MSGFFRRPGVDSSDNTRTDDDEHWNHQRREDPLHRIETVDASTAAEPSPSPIQAPPSSKDTKYLRDLALHSLLERNAYNEARLQLGPEASEEDIKRATKEIYTATYQQLPGVSDADRLLASDRMRRSRKQVQEGLSSFAQQQLNRIVPTKNGQHPQILSRGASRASSPLHSPFQSSQKAPVTGWKVPSTPTKTAFPNIPVPPETPLMSHPGFHFDKYRNDFDQLNSIGKGGYGKVFKVKHKLDQSLYAVKRIELKQKRLEKLRRSDEEDVMSSVLEEVRALAKFDHTNIVRYHHAWLEYSESSILSDSSSEPEHSRLLENGPGMSQSFSFADDDNMQASMGALSLHDSLDDGDGAVVFGYSDSGPDEDISDLKLLRSRPTPIQLSGSPRRRRRGTNATIETIMTTSSASSVPGLHTSINHEDDPMSESQLQVARVGSSRSRRRYLSESDHQESSLSKSNIPVLTLNVQMSLYDTNLAAFLAPDMVYDSGSAFNVANSDQLGHCFHPCISLELLQKIQEGVEYLHSQGVVHRDLKPANIFLSISDSQIVPAGSVDLATCDPCLHSPDHPALHVNPRIGDFGLVATLSDNSESSTLGRKPVGTELYRPNTLSTISTKLDIFSLGVIAFELLYRFNTRMERFETLTALKAGTFPTDFATRLGTYGPHIEMFVKGMVKGEEEERLDSDNVKELLGRLVKMLKGEGR